MNLKARWVYTFYRKQHPLYFRTRRATFTNQQPPGKAKEQIMGDTCENIGQLRQDHAEIPTRSNCECLAELGFELRDVDYKLQKLKDAIAADPASVKESSKALWPLQLTAMKAYKKALQARIIDLIDNDKD